MPWQNQATLQLQGGVPFQWVGVPSARASALIVMNGSVPSLERRRWADVSILRPEFLYGTPDTMEFNFVRCWHPITYLPHDVLGFGAIASLDNIWLLITAKDSIVVDIWQFLL